MHWAYPETCGLSVFNFSVSLNYSLNILTGRYKVTKMRAIMCHVRTHDLLTEAEKN